MPSGSMCNLARTIGSKNSETEFLRQKEASTVMTRGEDRSGCESTKEGRGERVGGPRNFQGEGGVWTVQ